MAKKFYYPVKELNGATITDGTHNGTTFTSSNSLTNEERLFDQSIKIAVTDFGVGDAIRVGFDSSITVTFIALYFTAEESDNFILYGDDAADGSNLNVISTSTGLTDTFPANAWTVVPFSTTDWKYFFLRSTTGGINRLTEIVLRTAYTFDVKFPTGDDEFDRSNVDIIKSGGKQEYSNKVADLQRIWTWKWDIPTVAMRASLRTFNTAIDKNFLKFIFYNDEDSTNYWVRMSADSLKFKRVHYNYWETNVKLTQQLS